MDPPCHRQTTDSRKGMLVAWRGFIARGREGAKIYSRQIFKIFLGRLRNLRSCLGGTTFPNSMRSEGCGSRYEIANTTSSRICSTTVVANLGPAPVRGSNGTKPSKEH
ncbi:hypothetical protein TNCV_1903531 [Trichonephila clavipes]|nr:hypothetical protein TNCV_1903531 [Trichonephila clavipes]